MAYAHAVIEVPRNPEDPSEGVIIYKRGDSVPSDLRGFDELSEYGSVSDEPYDPSNEPTQIPDYVEIDGVRYVKTGDGATTEGVSNA